MKRANFRWSSIGVILFFAVVAFYAFSVRAPDANEQATQARQPIKNCLFIILDATAASHIGAWGYERDTTPYIDELAESAFVFANAHSQASSTLPSTWSFLTGRYPLRPPTSDVDANSHRIIGRDWTLARAFRNSGFKTLGFSQNPFIREAWRFDAGFDEFTAYPVVDGTGTRDEAMASAMFDDVTASIAAAEAEDRPWFGYIHYLRPHAPYTAPSPYGEKFMDPNGPRSSDARHNSITLRSIHRQPVTRAEAAYMRDSYDSGLSYADFEIGQFIELLRAQGALDDTLLIIASDHGEGFMQHGLIGHGFILFEEMLQVPLLFVAPEHSGLKPGRSDALVEMVDVYPTLIELFNLTAPGYPMDGQSLLPALKGEKLTQKPVAYAQTFDGRTIAVRIGEMKMICDVSRERAAISNIGVFDLSNDPGERVNLYGKVPIDDLVLAAGTYVQRWNQSKRATELTQGDLPQEVLDELEALGYLRE